MTYGIVTTKAHGFGNAQVWQNILIGGGGFVTGIDVANDGTQVIRADVYGAYVNTVSSPTWVQMQTGTAFGSQVDQAGPYEIAIAKTDSTRIYILASDGFLYKSTNTGVSFTKNSTLNGGVALSGDLGGNRNESGLVFATRNNGRFMAVDPHDPNVLYVCSPTNGVFLTLDGGSTWQTISGIPAATLDTGQSLGTCVAIDPVASPVNGRSPKVYIMAYGSQMLKCVNGGSATPTFTATTSGPTTITHMVVDSDGTVVYVADNSQYPLPAGSGTGGTLWTYNVAGATWTNQSLTSIHAIAADPVTAGRVILSDDAGQLSVSTTHGSSPTALSLGTKNFTDIPWLGVTPNTFYTGDMAFNPNTSKLTLTMGLGVVTSTPPNSGAVNWTNQSAGIEELVTNFVLSSPNYTYPLGGFWDRPLFKIVDPNVYPTTQRPNNSRAITMGWAGDYVKSAPGTLVSIVNYNGSGDDSGISTDGGLTWTSYTAKPNKIRLTTNSSTALNSGTFNFASVPSLLVPSTLGGNRQVKYLGIAAVTTAPSLANSQVLHFGGGLPGSIAASCNVMTDEQQVINGLLFDSAITINYLGTTGDVQLDGGPHVDLPTGTTVYFLMDGSNSINPNVTVSATTGTTVTLTNEPSGHSILSGSTLEFTSGISGCIAASTSNNIMWVGSNDEPYPWYTKDGGVTWKNAVLETSTNGFGSAGQALPDANGDGTGWGHAYYINCICVAADPVTANRFVIYNGRLLTTDGAGLWDTTDGGDTWTKRVIGRIGGNSNAYNARILGVPGNAHHFFLSGCGTSIGQNNPLMWSTDTNNATWTQIANVSTVTAFGIGAAKPGNNYPTVYLAGKVGGTAGIWRGTGNLSDWQAGTNTGTMVTWDNINGTFGLNALDWLDQITAVEGDASVYGRCYLGRAHSGVAMGYLA